MSDNKINLPQTNFSMKANLAQKEPQMVKTWEEQDIYNKILEKNKNNPKFILHDGPPYANGHIHLGHALNKVLKDIILKYEAMNGKFTPYIPGWDCHGLPIEYQLLKEMGLDKNSVEQLKFRQQAQKYALKHVKIQKDEFKRLGVLGDWENPYLTLNPEYEANIIKVFKELVKHGYIYRGLKPVYWCGECETALAEAEVEYQDHTSKSVYVKFPLENEKNTSILIWTTTPWTLPSNVAVAFHPEFEYVFAEIKETSNKNLKINERLVLSKELLAKIAENLGIVKYEIKKLVLGKELENIKCQSPYRKDKSVGILADFVTVEDGTGIVHIAPGHGEDDYLAGLKYNLPVIAPVNSKGEFTNEVEADFLKGKNIFKANSIIVEDLDNSGLLLKMEEILHSYPHCWRCKSPVIFRATSQWFMKIDHNDLRKKLLEICKDVNWLPEYGFKRITSMIENRPDWCLSRQRLWGTPIPAFYCENCEELLLTEQSMTKVENAFREKGSDVWFYKSASEILGDEIKCPKCSSQKFRKETDILDVWFDSGVSYQAVLKTNENLAFPADMYLEGSDQHRGWFQASIIPAVALHGTAPYKTVLTHGFTVDGNGKKMSKSLGNVVSPHEIMNTLGADILRLWIASENYRNDMPISDEIIKQMTDSYRKIRNTIRYILGNLAEFDFEKQKIEYQDMLEIDKWAFCELLNVSEKIIKAYDKREFHSVYREFYNFCTITLSARYFDILKDRLYVYAPKSIQRRSAQTVLYYLADYLTKFIAPIMPFTANEIWDNFVNKKDKQENILLENMPNRNVILSEAKYLKYNNLIEKWEKIFEFRGLLLKKIEEKRLEGVLGNSLEAKVIVKLKAENPEIELTKSGEELWSKIAIVSQFEVCIGDEESIVVEKAKGKKCERCWNYVEDKDMGEKFCKRCEGILKKW